MPEKKSSTTKKTAAKKSIKKVSKKVTAKKSVVKKTVKKAIAKKTPAQKTTKNAPMRMLVCADGKHCFWTTDGQVLSNLIELRDSLDQMADKVFSYHANKEKNDFADWVEYILQDEDLALALRAAQRPRTARTVVVRRLKTYEI